VPQVNACGGGRTQQMQIMFAQASWVGRPRIKNESSRYQRNFSPYQKRLLSNSFHYAHCPACRPLSIKRLMIRAAEGKWNYTSAGIPLVRHLPTAACALTYLFAMCTKGNHCISSMKSSRGNYSYIQYLPQRLVLIYFYLGTWRIKNITFQVKSADKQSVRHRAVRANIE
jgi:hypothetical protein